MLPASVVAFFSAVARQLCIPPHLAYVVLVFFAYSFCGYIMECIVLSIEKKQLVVNRGFTGHLPFCVIYGFGALIGFALLSPLANTLLLLFIVGAISATCFEFLTAQLQIRLFGDFWWDYTKKPLNYKGMLCLESTLGWGVLALLIVRLLHHGVVGVVARVPLSFAVPLAAVLLLAYVIDFAHSARAAARQKQQLPQPDADAYAPEHAAEQPDLAGGRR